MVRSRMRRWPMCQRRRQRRLRLHLKPSLRWTPFLPPWILAPMLLPANARQVLQMSLLCDHVQALGLTPAVKTQNVRISSVLHPMPTSDNRTILLADLHGTAMADCLLVLS